MRRIRKLFGLPSYERWLLLKAVALLWAVRLSLWLLPFAGTRQLLNWASRRSRRLSVNPTPVERLAWAVGVASRFVPGTAHCLTRALAAKILLARRGYPAKVCYGVLPESTEPFTAHAWVESNGVVVVGGPDVGRYVRLTASMGSIL